MWRIALISLFVPALALAGFRASSIKQDSRHSAMYWSAAAALDSNLETAWIVDVESENKGEWIEIDLPRSEIDKISIVAGWDKDEKTFFDHARIAGFRLDLFTKKNSADKGTLVASHDFKLEDKRGIQLIDVPDTEVGSDLFGGHVRITVTSIYEGRDFPYLAVSDMSVILKETENTPSFREEPDNFEGDHLPMAMIDGDKRSYWASEGPGNGQTFRVEADGFGLSQIGLTSGPKSFARPKVVEIIASDVVSSFTMENHDKMQWFDLPVVIGYTGSVWGAVTVRVLETWPAADGAGVAISEVMLKSTNYEGL